MQSQHDMILIFQFSDFSDHRINMAIIVLLVLIYTVYLSQHTTAQVLLITVMMHGFYSAVLVPVSVLCVYWILIAPFLCKAFCFLILQQHNTGVIININDPVQL